MDGGAVLHWYDFICPLCYVAQQRNAILARRGIEVVELPFPAPPEVPPQGIPAGPRTGPMYALLKLEDADAGLPLRWQINTRRRQYRTRDRRGRRCLCPGRHAAQVDPILSNAALERNGHMQIQIIRR